MTREEVLQRIVDNNFVGEYGFDLQILIDCMVTVREMILSSQFPVEDCISRQAAIDACLDGFCACVNDCVNEIKKLPSTQPEIIRCKDCKYWTNNVGDYKLRDNYCNEKAHGFYYQCNGDDYCSFAERRADE